MRIRHKVPSIFSLSMVDVLCCALGCVILIWLLNAKQSEDEADERREEIESFRLRAHADQLESARLLADARAEYARASGRLRQMQGERSRAAAAAVALERRIRDLEALRSSLTRSRDAARGEVKSSAGRVAALEADLRAAVARADGLDGSLGRAGERLKKEEAALRSARADLAALRARAGDLEKSLSARDREIKDLETLQARHAAALKREQALDGKLRARQAELDEAGRTIAALERSGRDVDGRLARAEKEKEALWTAAENRFAGITLSGKKVVFLVDTSGSMTMLDAGTDAPQKWKEVCDTVARLLRSMPEVQKYQVITFAKTTDFPLGSAGKWLPYDAATSPAKARKALREIQPSGGTNMYAALEAAFAYRDSGLDTIYLLSDGLPNQGEGVSAAERLRLSESERSQRLGRAVLAKLRAAWNKPFKGWPRVRINTVGFFYESPDLGAFLWALARENDGSFVGMSTP